MPKRKVETICWKCACATGSPDHPCPWAQRGKPVEGWEATKGQAYRFKHPRTGKTYIKYGYIVHSCPLFDQDKKYIDYFEIVDLCTEYFHISQPRFYRHAEEFICRYEDETGEFFDEWVHIKAISGPDDDEDFDDPEEPETEAENEGPEA